ncbi:hypothetical protein BH10PAT3_BH10PAT3_4330 [soil metagenome]
MKHNVVPKNAFSKTAPKKTNVTTLKKLLLYYQEITDTIREPFVILDNNLCVVTANEAFYVTFKVSRKETEKKLIYKLGNNQWESAGLRELLGNILPKHKIMNDFEISHVFPKIGQKTMLLNARQVDSKQLILLAIEDITELKRLQIKSEKMTTNLLEQHTKLKELNDAKDEFVSMASHQLRTPATIVKQYTTMLRDGYAGDLTKQQTKMLNSAIFSNERQLEIIEDLLRVARLEAGKVYLAKTTCNVTRIINSVIREQNITFNSRKQNVVFRTSPKDTHAYMDKKLMRMVIENLLDNAGKYSQLGKTMTITLRQNAKQTTISFDDEGVGILKKDLKKLFKKFSRINNSMSESTVGTGLGLYWVRKIIELHSGSITATSIKGHGSKFTVNLPILRPARP